MKRNNNITSRWIFVAAGLLGVLSTQLHAKITVTGTVVENRLGGKGLAGARVRVETNDRISNPEGRFAAVAVDKKVGQVVGMTVTKPGFEVVNEFDLRMTIRKPGELPMTVILCEEGLRDHFAAQHYRINVERLIRERFKQESAKIDPASDTSEQEIRDLGIELTQALSQVDDLSQALAKVRAGEITDLYREAFALLQEGKLDEADEHLADAVIDQQIARDKEKLRNTLRSYLLKAQIRVSKFDFEGAEKYYQKAVNGDPSWFEAIVEMANYQKMQNQFPSSIASYRQAIQVAKSDSETAKALNGLGSSQSGSGDTVGALRSFQQALDIRERLATANPAAYEADLAITLDRIGATFLQKGDVPRALGSFQRALKIYERNAEANPTAHEPNLATILNNLAGLHSDNGNVAKALEFFHRSLVIRERLAKANPAAYEADLAMTLNNLGLTQSRNKNPAKALERFQQGLELYERLALQNPDRYEPYLAMILGNLGKFHHRRGNVAGALENYQRALVIEERLAKTNPAVHEDELARVLNGLGILQAENGNAAEALELLQRNLVIAERLAKADPAAHESELARVHFNLGSSHLFAENDKEAIKSFQRALAITERLAQGDPAAHESELAKCLSHLGLSHSKNGDAAEALKNYELTLDIYKRLAKQNPDHHKISVARSMVLISELMEKDSEKQKWRNQARSILEKRRDDPEAKPLLDFLNQ